MTHTSLLFRWILTLVMADQAMAQRLPKFEAPTETVDASGGKAGAADAVTVRCLAYPTFAIMVKSDPEIKGDRFSTRLRQKKEGDAKLCEVKSAQRDVAWSIQNLWLKGVIGPWTVLTDEGLGSANRFVVVRSRSGKKVFEDGFSEDQGYDLHIGPRGKWAITYARILETPCDVMKGGDACWALVLKTNDIPASARLERPDCGPAQKLDPVAVQAGALHLAADVEVADIERPKRRYIGGKTYCAPHP